VEGGENLILISRIQRRVRREDKSNFKDLLWKEEENFLGGYIYPIWQFDTIANPPFHYK
jgi:hypothetical protein